MKKGDVQHNNNQEQNRVQEKGKAFIPKDDREHVNAAHDQAEKDMNEDADLTASSPNDDLDEGESARLGEDNTDLV
jgi:hypothetical protein